jgi:sulfur-carrier protein adenylyltransferase/sulfurtransferase
MDFTPEELNRYSRHLLLKEVGPSGQRKLKNAKVLLIGAGGLGSPIGFYLAAAGVGQIGIIDFDHVEISNLQRQIVFQAQDVNKSKALLAKDRLLALNPHIDLQAYSERLSVTNASELISRFDIVVDGSDNFDTRYLVNDACFFAKKPLVYGSIYQFEGQVSLFNGGEGPCYRCLFPSPPPEGLAPNCSEAGVLGVLPGIIGTLQANEALKWILQIGDPLLGRLLILDSLAMRFSEFALRKNPACPLCGSIPSITELRAEHYACELPVNHQIPELAPKDFATWRTDGKRFFLLDVREQSEYELANLGGHLIPLPELSARLDELDPQACILVHCASGKRSLQACEQLKSAGFKDVWNLQGGIKAIK